MLIIKRTIFMQMIKKEKHMKKNYCFLLLMLIGCLLMCGCSEEQVKIIVPEGMPYIMLGDMDERENVVVENVPGAAALKSAFASKDYDIIVAPLNLGVQLYNAGQTDYNLEAVLGMSNLFIITKPTNQLESLSDITTSDKALLAFGEGNTPEVAIKAAFAQNSIEKNVEYLNSVSEVLPFFIQDKYDYVVAAEPVLSVLKMNKKIDFKQLDLQSCIEVPVIQAAIFTSPDSNKKDEIDKVLLEIKDSVQSARVNVNEYTEKLVAKNDYFQNFGVDVLKQSILNCNMQYIKASNYRIEINGYLDLIEYTHPNDEFYRK